MKFLKNKMKLNKNQNNTSKIRHTSHITDELFGIKKEFLYRIFQKN